jgi:hypothetical protein
MYIQQKTPKVHIPLLITLLLILILVSWIPAGAQTTLTRQVVSGTDDAEEAVANGTAAYPVGYVKLTSGQAPAPGQVGTVTSIPNLQMVHEGNIEQLVGIRFTDLTIPNGATITNAYIQFTPDLGDGGPVTIRFQAQAADDAATFTTDNGNISDRARTTEKVLWTFTGVGDEWITTTVASTDPLHRTPNLAPVVQEVVDRPGWTSGYAMAFIASWGGASPYVAPPAGPSGQRRTAKSFERDPAQAPVLTIEYVVNGVGNTAPTVNAGSDQNITLPASATLDGTVTDDGLPTADVTTLWTKVSGPGDVTFAEDNAVDTTASFSAPGAYVLRLTANDGALATSDEIAITVAADTTPTNEAPTVDAGPNQTITLPSTATLDGTVTDDGIPAVATTLWTKVSGPGDVTFAEATAMDTTATFSAVGSYVLSLTATDGELSDSDEITITVTDDTTPTNEAPTVNAGTDQTITLPASATLDGTVTDDSLPTADVTTLWTKVSGSGDVTFAEDNAVNTTASFSAPGAYVLRLTANDGEIAASDDITITVVTEQSDTPSLLLPSISK